ncbi:MAG: ion transporter [Pseudomonadota bacterium]
MGDQMRCPPARIKAAPATDGRASPGAAPMRDAVPVPEALASGRHIGSAGARLGIEVGAVGTAMGTERDSDAPERATAQAPRQGGGTPAQMSGEAPVEAPVEAPGQGARHAAEGPGRWRQHARLAIAGSHPHLGRLVPVLVSVLIVATAIAVALETVEGMPHWVYGLLVATEIAAVRVFGVEDALRLASARRPLGYATSFWGIVDLLSFLPTLLFLTTDFASLRTLRLLRLLRLLKLTKGEDATDRLAEAIGAVRGELFVVLAAACITLYLAAVGIYHFEHRAQPEAFGSIPESLWWAVATLTTVGYGDVVPVTTGGRIFTGLVMLLGIGVVAVPTGLVATALIAARRARHEATSRAREGADGRGDGSAA